MVQSIDISIARLFAYDQRETAVAEDNCWGRTHANLIASNCQQRMK